jgi:hypothetical protein
MAAPPELLRYNKTCLATRDEWLQLVCSGFNLV